MISIPFLVPAQSVLWQLSFPRGYGLEYDAVQQQWLMEHGQTLLPYDDT